MISIRKGCFETNSSSMHSLAIWKNVKEYGDYDLSLGTKYNRDKEDGEFELLEHCYNDGDDYRFGRAPYKQLRTPIQKLRYIVGYYITYKYPEEDEGKEVDYDSEPIYYFENKEVEKELYHLIEKYTGYKKVKWYKEVTDWKYVRTEDGKDKRVCYERKEYPDTDTYNDSGEDVMHFIKRKNITLEDLIFSPKYTIQVDGDEYQEWKDMFKFNMINIDNLEDISSGIDYWTDNEFTFYIEHTLDNEFGPKDDCKPYLDRCREDIKDGMLIEVGDGYNYPELIEEHYQKASEFLLEYHGRCRFVITNSIPQEMRDKYFNWVKI